MEKRMIERIVPWTVNGESLPSFLCTPHALDELAAGHLLTQGQISDIREIRSIDVDGLSIRVATKHALTPVQSLEKRLDALRPVTPKRTFSLKDAHNLMQALLQVETYYGTHCLALQTPSVTHFREDIGRHNALDKIIGRGALDGMDFSACAAAATGRISFEMLLKAASAGIPFIVSKKYPSDLSVEVANRLGICIVGNALAASPVIYSAQDRLEANASKN